MTTPIEIGNSAKFISFTGEFDTPAPRTFRLLRPNNARSSLPCALVDLEEGHLASVQDYPEFTTIQIIGPDTDEHYCLADIKPIGSYREFVVYNSSGEKALRVGRGEKLPEDKPGIKVLRQEFHIKSPSILEKASKAITVFASRLYNYQRHAAI